MDGDDGLTMRFVASRVNPRGRGVAPVEPADAFAPLPVVVRAAEVTQLMGFDEIPELGWAALWLAFRRVVAAIDGTFLVEPRSEGGQLRPAVRTAEGLRVRNSRVERAVNEVAELSSVTCEVCGRAGGLRTAGRNRLTTLCDGHDVVVPR
jgi:hypothetical protein